MRRRPSGGWPRAPPREPPGAVACCYEAGPCGFTPQRSFGGSESICAVVAPSLIPVKPGERIKTDRRDARKLAELFRAHLLTAVHRPRPRRRRRAISAAGAKT